MFLVLGTHQAAALSLNDGFNRALANDPQYLAAKAALEASREALPQARGRILPNISITSSRYRVEQERTDNGITGRTQRYSSESDGLSIRQPLVNLRLFSGLDQAESSVLAAEAQFTTRESDLLNRYLTSYFNVFFTKRREQLIASQLKSAETRLTAAQKSFQAGLGTRTDVNEVEAQRDLLLAQHLAAHQAAISALVELEIMTGTNLSPEKMKGHYTLDAEQFEPGGLGDWLIKVEQNNPSSVQRKNEELAAFAALKGAQADHYPTLEVIAQITRNIGESAFFVNTETDSKAIGVQLTVPLFQGGGISSRVRQVAANYSEAQHNTKNALNAGRIEATRAFYAIREGMKKVKAFENAQVSAQLAVEANQKSFRAGIRTFLDILNAEQKLVQVQTDLTEAQLQLVLAYARLQLLSGNTVAAALEAVATRFKAE